MIFSFATRVKFKNSTIILTKAMQTGAIDIAAIASLEIVGFTFSHIKASKGGALRVVKVGTFVLSTHDPKDTI